VLRIGARGYRRLPALAVFALDAFTLCSSLAEKALDDGVPSSLLQVIQRDLGSGTHDLSALALVDYWYEGYGPHGFLFLADRSTFGKPAIPL
jgi:hypothetical protein